MSNSSIEHQGCKTTPKIGDGVERFPLRCNRECALGLDAGMVKLWPLLRRLSMDENAKLIAELQADGVQLRTRLREVEDAAARYRRKCDQENDVLREDVRAMRDEIHGLRNQIVLQQAERIVNLARTPGPDVVEAAIGFLSARDVVSLFRWLHEAEGLAYVSAVGLVGAGGDRGAVCFERCGGGEGRGGVIEVIKRGHLPENDVFGGRAAYDAWLAP